MSILCLLISSLPVGPPQPSASVPMASLSGPPQSPASCETIYDAELGQMDPIIGTDPVANLNSTLRSNTLYDVLVADDFIADQPGRITDVFTYSNLVWHFSEPADGVRFYLWGTGEVPTQDPTLVLEIPLNQIRLRYIRTLSEDIFLEIHVPNLDIPFQPGRTWFTVQPRDETPGEGGYYWICRNANRPLQGADAYIKDGPNGQGGWGFTEWRSAGSQGLGAADSYVRIEGYFDPISISVEGECGGLAQFGWTNAPPDTMLTFLYARQAGSVRLPPNLPCGGTQLGLGRRLLQIALTVDTGNGAGVSERFLPARACPGYFQAVIGGAGPCQTSNVISTP